MIRQLLGRISRIRRIQLRMALVLSVLLGMLIAVIWRTHYVHAEQGDELVEKSERQTKREMTLKARRGSVQDRNLVSFAQAHLGEDTRHKHGLSLALNPVADSVASKAVDFDPVSSCRNAFRGRTKGTFDPTRVPAHGPRATACGVTRAMLQARPTPTDSL